MKIVQVIDLLRHKLVRLATEEDFEVHDYVMLKNERDKLVGQVVSRSRDVPNARVDDGYELIEKLGTNDVAKFKEILSAEHERVALAKTLAEELKLPMRFFASRCDLSGKVFSFFFTSEDKVDFRDLLKTLPKKVNSRVHLQRVGARDRAKILGGFGRCGRATCCSSFKIELDSVPLDSARDQNLLTRDNNKLYGLCGKLKCCLLYEVDLYRDLRRNLPHIKQAVIADGKDARVTGLDILNQRVKIIYDETGGFDVLDIADVKKKFAPQKPKPSGNKPSTKKPERSDTNSSNTKK